MTAVTKKTVLGNGIRILTHQMPHVHSVSMGVWVNAGARDETPAENGLSHLIEHMIFKGTTRRSAFQIAKEFDAIGGHTNAFTSMENTCYHAKVIDTHLATMAEILTDIFLNSRFSQDDLAKEQPVICQEIGMVEDSPEEYVHVLSSANYWRENPLGQSILGTRENVLKFNAATVSGFFHHLYQPDRIVISGAGNLEHDRFVDLVGPAFEAIEKTNGFPQRQVPTSASGVSVYSKDLEQVHICCNTMGFSITDPRRYAFSLLSTVLGGNMSSRLFQEIREQRGLAYSVYSFISAYEDTGIFGVYAGVAPEKVTETIDLITNELQKIKKTAVTGNELDSAREYTKGSLLLAAESVDNQMVRLAQNEFHFGRYVPLEEIVKRIDTVTEADVMELAGLIFQPDQVAMTILGPVSGNHSFDHFLTL